MVAIFLSGGLCMKNAKAKHAKVGAKRARDDARLEKEATATAQANEVDAQASASART